MLQRIRRGDTSLEAFVGLWREWGNPFSLNPYALRAAFLEALAASCPILELGSGLSTAVLGLAAERSGVPVFTLEESPSYASLTRDFIERESLAVRLHLSVLTDGWFQLPADLPHSFGLVVVDGPQADLAQRGQLYARLADRIKAATVIADDIRIHAIARPFDRWVLTNHRRAERFTNFAISRPS